MIKLGKIYRRKKIRNCYLVFLECIKEPTGPDSTGIYTFYYMDEPEKIYKREVSTYFFYMSYEENNEEKED